jgi:hypothetical protein
MRVDVHPYEEAEASLVALHPDVRAVVISFHVIHPFHPLSGQELERASGPPQESHRRVFFHTADGRLSSIPLTFTDLVEVDPFVDVSAGRAWLGIKDLLRLAELVGELGRERRKNV